MSCVSRADNRFPPLDECETRIEIAANTHTHTHARHINVESAVLIWIWRVGWVVDIWSEDNPITVFVWASKSNGFKLLYCMCPPKTFPFQNLYFSSKTTLFRTSNIFRTVRDGKGRIHLRPLNILKVFDLLFNQNHPTKTFSTAKETFLPIWSNHKRTTTIFQIGWKWFLR